MVEEIKEKLFWRLLSYSSANFPSVLLTGVFLSVDKLDG